MKVLGNLTVEKDSSVSYPFGANIQNETDTVSGTPVVREIYGDVLMNIYKILKLTNIVPTNTEDNDTTQYQLIEALKKLPNSLNDIEQVLTLSSGKWTVPLDLSILPNKYFFIARASDDYVSASTFKGSGALELPFSSTGFSASDELLVIIDSLGVRAYSLSKLNGSPAFINTIIPTPIRYNNEDELYYLDNGKLYKNLQVWDLQNSIRVDQSDGTLILQNVFFMQGYAVCVVKNPATVNYEFYAFDLIDLNTVIVLTSDNSQTPSTDFLPEFYSDDFYLYATNGANTDPDSYVINVLVFNPVSSTLNYFSDTNIDPSFVKTANGAVANSRLFILESGKLDYYSLPTFTKISVGDFPISGHLFSFNDELYLNQNNVASKLII